MTYLKSQPTFLLLSTMFFILLTASILAVYYRNYVYERPLLYFFFLFFSIGIITLEILLVDSTKKYHISLVIIQIIILNLSIIFSQYFIFPNVLGLDPWVHQMFTSQIINTDFLPKGFNYSNLPIMHLVIALNSLFTGLDYKFSAIFSITIAQVICGILFVYLLGKNFFGAKIGLFAGFLLGLSNYFINMGLFIIPNTIGAIFILIIIYLILKINIERYLIRTSLILFFMIILILTHTVSAMCMAIILFILLIFPYFYNYLFHEKIQSIVSLNIAVFFSVAMFSWWIYSTGHIHTLGDIIKIGFSPDFFIHAPQEVIGYLTTVPIFEQLMNQLGMFLFFSISLIGFFYMISKKHGNTITINYALIGIIPLTIGFVSLIIGTYVIPDRWWYFSQIFLSLSVAIALIIIYNRVKYQFSKSILLIFITVFITFMMIMSPDANIDNAVFSPNTGVRLAMTESELTAASFFIEKSIDTLSVDSDYSNVFINYFNLSDKKLELLDFYLLKGEFNLSRRIIILRYLTIEKPFRLFGQPFKLNYNPKLVIENEGYSSIYDSKSISFYIPYSNK